MRIRIKVTAYAEEQTVEQAAKENNDVAGFAKSVRQVRAQCREKNISEIWSWCCIAVRATIRTKGQKYSGVAYLGECSYVGKDDFIANSGYYEDLLDEAVKAALREWRAYRKTTLTTATNKGTP
jgi:hypothetical protein